MTPRRIVLAILLLFPLTLVDVARGQDISVFELPARHAQYKVHEQQLVAALRDERYSDAIRHATAAIEQMPMLPVGHYNLACALARNGSVGKAFDALDEAIAKGFGQRSQLEADTDLESLRIDPQWLPLLAKMRDASNNQFKQTISPVGPKDGIAMVEKQNTIWDPQTGALRVYFKPPQQTGNSDSKGAENAGTAERSKNIVLDHGNVGDRINGWWREGTAVGLSGVLYDNHDRDHSNMAYAKFPQLTRVEYGDDAKQLALDHGLQHRMLFNGIAIGNSSTSNVGGPYWRSQPRLAYANPEFSTALARQYFSNHVYVYPEHRDHDPDASGYGDTFPTNTPFVTVSQGSSYSDRRFLDAFALTLASLRPDVRAQLTAAGLIAPTLQMIMRRCYQGVDSDADYRSGTANPTVFDGQKLRPAMMVDMAHAIKIDALPPITMLKLESETQSVVGRDYFDIGPRESLISTNTVIARLCRSMSYQRRMVLDASGSRDLNGKPLTYHWSVLRGDRDRIQIQPLNEDSSRVEITVAYHPRRPIAPKSGISSSRVDIGVFTSNDRYHSAPAMVTFCWPANERRVYKGEKIQEVVYESPNRESYIDPLLISEIHWRDTYQYDDGGERLGWTRHQSGQPDQSFTRDGLLVETRDDEGRPIIVREVTYVPNLKANVAPQLMQKRGRKSFRYRYENSEDRLGQREPLPAEL